MSNVKSKNRAAALVRLLSLEERVGFVTSRSHKFIPARKLAHAKKTIATWKARKPYSNGHAFVDRLTDLGIDERILCESLALPVDHSVRMHVRQKKVWNHLSDLIRGHRVPRHQPKEWDDVRFPRLVIPLIEQHMSAFRLALREIMRRDDLGTFDEERVCKRLRDDLIKQANWVVEKTCLLELRVAKLRGQLKGNSGAERFESFLQLLQRPEFVSQLLQEYPVLLEAAATRLQMVYENTLEFITRLAVDIPSIEEAIYDGEILGTMAEFEGGKGDSHCGGKSVVTISFDSGKKLIYKPRSLAVDIGFNRIIEWCNERLPISPLRSVRSLDRGTYGWCEHVVQHDMEFDSQISEFFYRQGKFIALLYALHATDMHCENMIASGADPVYIDLETLFHPPQWVVSPTRAVDANFGPPATVLDTLILPVGRQVLGDDNYAEISIFRGDPNQRLRGARLELIDGDTDEARLRQADGRMGISSHLPKYRGRNVSPDGYVDEVCRGFSDLYRVFASEAPALLPKLLELFSDACVRYVPRPTALYFGMVRQSLHPDYLRDGMERRALFERLYMGTGSRHLNRLLDAEIRDLANLDVPYFSRRFFSHQVFDSHGREVGGVMMPSPADIVDHRLSRLCDSDLTAQIKLIRQSLLSELEEPSLSSVTAPEDQEGNAGVSVYSPMRLAIKIAELLKVAMVCCDSYRYWMCQKMSAKSVVTTGPNVLDLYDGQLGIALFFGMCAAVTGRGDYLQIFMQGMDTVRCWTRGGRTGFHSVGVFTGAMGYPYVLASVGGSLNRPELIAEALDWLDWFDPSSEHDGLDVVDGAAGCILFLANLMKAPQVNANRRLLLRSLLEFFGRRLVAEAKREFVGIGWRPVVREGRGALTGFAHGNAGFAAALFVCAAVLGDEKYRRLGSQAVQFENHQFSTELGGWRDLLDGKEGELRTSRKRYAWCHGVPGIILGRMIALETLNNTDDHHSLLLADVIRGLSGPVEPEHYENESLCHGSLGNNEIREMARCAIFSGGLYSPEFSVNMRPSGRDSRCSHLLRCGDSERNPIHCARAAPGLMLGVSGIGYGLLRRAAPHVVPSVLRLEVVGSGWLEGYVQ